jgi:hypothetical protein
MPTGKYIRTPEIRERNSDSLICDALWDIDNGITLCKSCHDSIKGG